MAPALRDAIATAIAGQKTLEDVVRWALCHTPPLVIQEIIVQDEYTHDVVIGYRDDVYLVYDTT